MKNILKTLLLTAILFTFANLTFAKDLDISLSPEVNKVEAGKTARVRVNFTNAPKKFLMTDISIDGGRVESVRKLSTRVYVAIVHANDDAKEIELQVQADSIRDGEGDLNENASNSVSIKVIPNTEKVAAENNAKVEQINNENQKAISSLLEAVTTSARNNAAQAIQQQSAAQVQYYMCNGVSIPSTQQCTIAPQNNAGTVITTPGYYDFWGNWIPPTQSIQTTQTVNALTPVYNPYNTYNSYGSYGSYGVTPVYDSAYYNNYYYDYGHYPQSYYSSSYYYGYKKNTLYDILSW